MVLTMTLDNHTMEQHQQEDLVSFLLQQLNDGQVTEYLERFRIDLALQ